MKTYVVDIDGTICTNTYGEYNDAKPLDSRINFFNKLFECGHIVNYFTARGSTTSIDWREVTEIQLKEWGVKYNELIMGKPHGDVFIDDKAYNVINWDWCIGNIEDKSSVDSLLEIDSYLINTCNSFECLLNNGELKRKINNIGLEMQKTLSKGGKIIFAGNGGSFGDAQHLSAS